MGFRIRIWAFQKLMLHEGLSQSGLARRIGMTPACVCRILSGKRHPSGDFVAAMTNSFPEYRQDWLFRIEGVSQ